MKLLALVALPLGLAIMLLLVRRQPLPPSIQPIPIPYAVIASPSVNASIAVMAIVPSRPSTSPGAAASLAAFARQQFSSVKSWKTMQIFVFSNLPAANRFNTYQMPRGQRSLRSVDYVALQKLWPSVLVFYEYRNGREKVLHPSRNPSGWWRAVR